MRFEWDPAKAASNIVKHDVAFEAAIEVWDDPLHVITFDRVEGGEERWRAFGLVNAVAVLVVVHSDPDQDDDRVRIISARKATNSERRVYEEGA